MRPALREVMVNVDDDSKPEWSTVWGSEQISNC